MKRLSYEQYKQTIRMAYISQESPSSSIEHTFPDYLEVLGWMTPEWVVECIVPSIELRLSALLNPLNGHIFNGGVRRLDVGTGELLIPIMNNQGKDWYSEAAIDNFDFIAERRIGLMENAKVIYDIGGHQGVWSGYYAKFTDAHTIYSFEPSLINVEISAVLHLINDIANVSVTAAAVGVNCMADGARSGEMQVDVLDGMGFRVVDFANFAVRRADFIKIDIEGYEHDLITAYPWVFSMADNFHLELHIPRLEERGLDYRDVMDLIPWNRFQAYLFSDARYVEVGRETPLSGYTSLMIMRR